MYAETWAVWNEPNPGTPSGTRQRLERFSHSFNTPTTTASTSVLGTELPGPGLALESLTVYFGRGTKRVLQDHGISTLMTITNVIL